MKKQEKDMRKKELDNTVKMFLLGWFIMIYFLIQVEPANLSILVGLIVLIPMMLFFQWERSKLKG